MLQVSRVQKTQITLFSVQGVTMVRIWRVPLHLLDRQHLLGEHHELHVIFNVITKDLKGFHNHPQTNRFKGHLGMLADRHKQQVDELHRRGYNHNSPLPDFAYYPEPYSYSEEEYQKDFELLMSRQNTTITPFSSDKLDLTEKGETDWKKKISFQYRINQNYQ